MDKAVVGLSAATATAFGAAASSPLGSRPSSQHSLYHYSSLFGRPFPCQSTKLRAKLGGDDDRGLKQPDKKKFITREQEPEQYWQTAGEREGENPMKTPLPYIIIFGMSTPFVILAIAFANGWIKAPILR